MTKRLPVRRISAAVESVPCMPPVKTTALKFKSEVLFSMTVLLCRLLVVIVECPPAIVPPLKVPPVMFIVLFVTLPVSDEPP